MDLGDSDLVAFLDLARLLASPNSDREWVCAALAWSNELPLRERLERLYARVPRPLIDHMPQPGVLAQRIANTRNYLTHFGERKKEILSGFSFSEATENMRQVVQFWILRELGFSERDALGIAHRTMVRDLSRSQTVRFMGTT